MNDPHQEQHYQEWREKLKAQDFLPGAIEALVWFHRVCRDEAVEAVKRAMARLSANQDHYIHSMPPVFKGQICSMVFSDVGRYTMEAAMTPDAEAEAIRAKDPKMFETLEADMAQLINLYRLEGPPPKA